MENYFKQKCFHGNLKFKIFTPIHKYMENITIKLVFFSIMGDCVCKIVCQFCGLGFCLLLGLSVSWLVVISAGFVFHSWVLGMVVGLLVGGYVRYWVCVFVGW